MNFFNILLRYCTNGKKPTRFMDMDKKSLNACAFQMNTPHPLSMQYRENAHKYKVFECLCIPNKLPPPTLGMQYSTAKIHMD